MRAGGCDQHDRRVRRHIADPVDDQSGLERPAVGSIGNRGFDSTLGHARIMLERESRYRAIGARWPDNAGKAHDGARILQRGAEGGDFGFWIERRADNADVAAHVSRR